MNDDHQRAAPDMPCGADEASADLCAVKALKARIREAVARHRAAAAAVAAHPVDWQLLAAGLRQVERHADIGSGTPELPRFRGPLRLLGRLLARCILYCARFLTNRQREYNNAVLNSLRSLAEGLRRLEESQLEELRRLRSALEQKVAEPAKKAA